MKICPKTNRSCELTACPETGCALEASPSSPCPPFWQGKRIVISWTDEAWTEGCEWPSFVVVTETEDGLFLRGCDAPDGTKHNGSHCFAKHSDIRDLWEWVSEANDKVEGGESE